MLRRYTCSQSPIIHDKSPRDIGHHVPPAANGFVLHRSTHPGIKNPDQRIVRGRLIASRIVIAATPAVKIHAIDTCHLQSKKVHISPADILDQTQGRNKADHTSGNVGNSLRIIGVIIDSPWASVRTEEWVFKISRYVQNSFSATLSEREGGASENGLVKVLEKNIPCL